MTVTKDFLQYVLDLLSGWGKVHVKRMFGCVALYQDHLVFAMIADDVVYMKVDDSNRHKFSKAGSTQLKPFKNNESMVVSFYNIPPDVFEDADEFIEWAKESLAIQKKRKKD
ncbi:TfoX/Sxy family protein [Saccharicrinis aurantiacus]|uniref:TfoX/Sxy family protein n=1 Tax=Saccharicrinis aurantiacus TaxID=1849719 RepID=UPI00095035A2|nr:TfoX/Sxy family protein [Saccharicrinis aurantiacus]